MKRIISMLLMMAIIFAFVPVMAFSGKITVSDFIYTDSDGALISEIPTSGEVRCEFSVKNNCTDEDISYVAALLYYNGGKLINMDVTSEKYVKAEESDFIGLTVATEENADMPVIVTCIWNSLEDMEALAPPAYFGTTEKRLYSLYVNGSPVELLDNVFAYNRQLLLGTDEIPGNIMYVPRDLAARVVFGRVNNIFTINVGEHNGENSNEYSITTQIQVPDALCVFSGTKKATSSKWFAKEAPGSSATRDLTWRMTDGTWMGSSERPYMRFKLPEIPEEYTVSRLTLTMYINAKTILKNTIIAKVSEEWDSAKHETGASPNEFPAPRRVADLRAASISLEPVTVPKGDGEWVKYEFELNPECLKDCENGALSVCPVMEFTADGTTKICVTSEEMIPFLSFELAE